MEYCHRERDLGPQTLVILSEVRVLEPSLCSDRESRVLFTPARHGGRIRVDRDIPRKASPHRAVRAQARVEAWLVRDPHDER